MHNFNVCTSCNVKFYYLLRETKSCSMKLAENNNSSFEITKPFRVTQQAYKCK